MSYATLELRVNEFFNLITMATGIENLRIYNQAKDLEIRVHKLAKEFPKEERFRSVDQLNRSSSSVTNNIAEAYYKRSKKEKIHILRDNSIAELEETRTNILRCADKNFLDYKTAGIVSDEYIRLRKAIFSYIKFLGNNNPELTKTRQLTNPLTHQLIN